MSNLLNDAQYDGATYMQGPCLVLAGAGSGKTRVITHKIVHILNHQIYEARHIAALTFTNKAAGEMQQRLKQLLPESRELRHLTTCTFHALGVQLLREEAAHIGFKARFSIMDSGDCLAILQDILATTDKPFLKAVQGQISNWKNYLRLPNDITPQSQAEMDALRVYPLYRATLQAYQAVDFDDLLLLPVLLFRDNDSVRDKWQRRLRYLLIDEYQDTNVAQYELIKLLTTGPGKKPLFTVVGDDDQAIYAWRGATLDNLAKIQTDFPDLKVITLEQNYRSTNTILQAANTLIQHNPKLFEKKLWSELGRGAPIVVTPMDSDSDEAEQVVAHLSRHKFDHGSAFSDYAILYRSNHQARLFEEALRNARMPYRLSGGQSFFERAEIRDVVSYLRLMVNPDDDLAFIRAITTPRRGIGQVALEQLGACARQWQISLFEAIFRPSVREFVSERMLLPMQEFGRAINDLTYRAERESAQVVLAQLLKNIDYEAYVYSHFDEVIARKKWQNVTEFCDWLGKKGEADSKTLIQLTQMVMLISMLDDQDADPNMVQLSTLHAAKGLEYLYVYLVGVEEGLLPHSGQRRGDEVDPDEPENVGRIEEERRLMYVGVTRARRALFISWCRKRKRQRNFVPCEISRFIAEMGLEKIESDPAPKVSVADRMAQIKAMLGQSS